MVGKNDMPTVRECDDCPWAYSNGYTEEWGCILFGKECEKCKKFDRDVGGCFYSQKKLERLAYEYKKRCRHAQKIAEGYSPYFKKPKTEKTPVHVAGRGFMYKPLDFCGAYEWNYVPNRKGGHHHRRNYCICNVCGNWFRKKNGIHEEGFDFCGGKCDSQAIWEASLERDVGGGFEPHFWEV